MSYAHYSFDRQEHDLNYVAAFVGGVLLYVAGVITEREGLQHAWVVAAMGVMYLYVAAMPDNRKRETT